MRGRRDQGLRLLQLVGTTPAYAGKTCAAPSWIARPRDHPRVCGEDQDDYDATVIDEGPPPRMRGRRLRVCFALKALRTTPAHAGKTSRLRWREHCFGDHPRACGEDFASASAVSASTGPPPRMRGRRHQTARLPRLIGTTPAHAGKTSWEPCPARYEWDHPRACGEDNGWTVPAWSR